jgi:hypothetical protein
VPPPPHPRDAGDARGIVDVVSFRREVVQAQTAREDFSTAVVSELLDAVSRMLDFGILCWNRLVKACNTFRQAYMYLHNGRPDREAVIDTR